MMSITLIMLPIFVAITSADVKNVRENQQGLGRMFDQCFSKYEAIKCFKINALKVVDRALHSKSLNLFEGISLVGNERKGRNFEHAVKLNESKLEKLDSQQIDDLLADTTARFLNTHKLEINVPRMIEEARRRRPNKGGGQGGALLWALAIKGSFLAMAYKGIAIMSGTALLVGKMALLLSAILGLKKLVSSGHEKTTFEIVKHPKYSESHTHSSSYEDDGHYRRNMFFEENPPTQKTAFRFYTPQ